MRTLRDRVSSLQHLLELCRLSSETLTKDNSDLTAINENHVKAEKELLEKISLTDAEKRELEKKLSRQKNWNKILATGGLGVTIALLLLIFT